MQIIKRNKIKEEAILKRLATEVPEFVSLEEFDNLIYVDYDRLGTYIIRLIDDLENNERVLVKIFNHLNSIFDSDDQLILNLLEVSIFESLVCHKYGYIIAKKHMSKELLKNFLDIFPYKKHKEDWDTQNHYTDEDLDNILKSLEN